jgi:hypothetical protein
MKTITMQAEVTADGINKFEVPCDVTPGQVEVVLMVQPRAANSEQGDIDWSRLLGLGREVWQGVNASTYPGDMRADREPSR